MTDTPLDNSVISDFIHQGDEFYGKHKHKDAIRAYEEALSILEKAGENSLKTTEVLLRLGDVYQSMAEGYYQQSIKIYRSICKQAETTEDPLGLTPPSNYPGKLARDRVQSDGIGEGE